MIQKLDIDVDQTNLEVGAKEILSVIRSQWNLEECKFKMFTEGITNKLMACQKIDDIQQKDVILIRVYGEKTDLIIDRDLEIRNMELMHKNGLAKPIYAKFNNGIAYGFISGNCLDEKTVRSPTITRLIADEMIRMHSITLDESKSAPCLFTKLKTFIDLSPDDFEDPDMNERLKKDILSKQDLYKELEFMKGELEPLNSPVVFTHNDLLLKNIVHSTEENRTYFIDFEYGDMNYEAFDIGDHFCEYAGIDTVDYDLYPDKEFQLGWLRYFLEQKYKMGGKNAADVTDTDVERLYVQTNKFALMAHFFWGVWALIQAKYSSIDFDYLDYAVVRMNEYHAKKDKFLALKMP